MDRRHCEWATGDPLLQRYHDEEWGVPIKDEVRLFELLCLEGAQAGLSWHTILQRREGYRNAFAGFRPDMVAAMDGAKQDELAQDVRIIRHRAKIAAVVGNAKALLAMRDAGEDFTLFLWEFVGGRPRQNAWRAGNMIPTETEESTAMSVALKKRGFRFVGPKICYAFMQASGMINDHLLGCYRYAEIAEWTT